MKVYIADTESGIEVFTNLKAMCNWANLSYSTAKYQFNKIKVSEFVKDGRAFYLRETKSK